MFFDDAKEASGILNVALTKRNLVPMCGIPHHAAENYIRRLIKAGKRVAICDQVERAADRGRSCSARSRTSSRPGTIADLQMLDAKRNNFLAAICRGHEGRATALPSSI